VNEASIYFVVVIVILCRCDDAWCVFFSFFSAFFFPEAQVLDLVVKAVRCLFSVELRIYADNELRCSLGFICGVHDDVSLSELTKLMSISCSTLEITFVFQS